jgi:hypothetical protein
MCMVTASGFESREGPGGVVEACPPVVGPGGGDGPACPAGPVRDGCGGTASARSLSCAECSSAGAWDGVRRLSPRPGPRGRPASTAHGGAGRDTRCSVVPSSSNHY